MLCSHAITFFSSQALPLVSVSLSSQLSPDRIASYRTAESSSCPSENSDLVGLLYPIPSGTFVAVTGRCKFAVYVAEF